MGLDEIVKYIVEAAKKEERRDKPVHIGNFLVTVKAKDLIVPSKNRSRHHREREQFYTKELEIAERNLREKGVSLEYYDEIKGYHVSVTSGAIGSGSLSAASKQAFQPKIDQTLMDNVKRAKEKMLEHRGAADGFDQYIRAFSLNQEQEIVLTPADVKYFNLGEQ
jgi:hypothetical protein